jgi:hypothetical protein
LLAERAVVMTAIRQQMMTGVAMMTMEEMEKNLMAEETMMVQMMMMETELEEMMMILMIA